MTVNVDVDQRVMRADPFAAFYLLEVILRIGLHRSMSCMVRFVKIEAGGSRTVTDRGSLVWGQWLFLGAPRSRAKMVTLNDSIFEIMPYRQ